MTTSFKMKLFRDDIDVDDLPEITCDDVVASNPVVIRDRQNVNEVKVSYSHVDEIVYRYLFVATGSGTVKTFGLGDYSNDTGTVFDSVEYDVYPQAGSEASKASQIIHSSGNIYVIVYRSRNQYNYIQTLSIDDDGIITLIEDYRINNCAYSGGVVKTSPGHFTTAYDTRYGPLRYGTFTVNNDGEINFVGQNNIWPDGSGGQVFPQGLMHDHLFFQGPPPPWPRAGALCVCALPPNWSYTGVPASWHLSYDEIEPTDTASNPRMVRVVNTDYGELDVYYYQRLTPNRLTMNVSGFDKVDVESSIYVSGDQARALALDGYPKVGIVYTVGETLHIKTYIVYVEQVGMFWIIRLVDADHKTFSEISPTQTVFIHKNKDKYLIGSGGKIHTVRIGNDGEISDYINTLNWAFIANDILKIRDH